jgi:hypothetical protein
MQEVVHVLEALRTVTPPPAASPSGITLQPRDFFVAFGGVLCVAFDGFPQCIERLKAALEVKAPTMIPENMGSKWAKATLGALGAPTDDSAAAASSSSVGVDTWLKLHDICLAFRAKLRATQVRVPCLAAVRLHNRLLSAGEVVCSLPSEMVVAAFPCTAAGEAGEGRMDVSAAMLQKTLSVLHELEGDRAAYFVSSLARGPTPYEHYASAAEGATLVMPLHRGFLGGGGSDGDGAQEKEEEGGDNNAAFYAVLQEFQRAAMEVMPGLKWSPATALHCTIRGIR